MDEIPVIDFGKFDSDPVAVAAAIRDACECIGFLFLKNVGIPQTEIDGMFELVRISENSICLFYLFVLFVDFNVWSLCMQGKEFFCQPIEIKSQFDIQANNVGYSALHREV
jgi:isopenicillin N synthase-like dioxygenase